MYRNSVRTFLFVSNFECSDGLYQICTHKFSMNIFLLLQILNTDVERMSDVTYGEFTCLYVCQWILCI